MGSPSLRIFMPFLRLSRGLVPNSIIHGALLTTLSQDGIDFTWTPVLDTCCRM